MSISALPTFDPRPTLTPDTVLAELAEGNRRFLSGHSGNSSSESLQKLKDFARIGQKPKAILLCCSDSRAPVEIIFDQDIGDLFVIRVAGNIIAPSLVGSVEFALDTFGTTLVMVMGHTQCGAIGATLDHLENGAPAHSDNIRDIVSRIEPHIHSIASLPHFTREQKMAHAVEANVVASVSELAHASPLIESLVTQEKIKVCGSILDLSTGEVAFLE